MVIAIEPYYDSVIRIHKAAKLAGVEKRIVVLRNAVSNKRNQVISLKKDWPPNSQAILVDDQVHETEDLVKNKLMVETIWLDDIIDYLPKTSDGKDFKKAIMKVDIEGFETLAFSHSRRLLTRLNIVTIFMEWGVIAKRPALYPTVKEFIDLLTEFGYTARNDSNHKLHSDKWLYWPDNIKWIKS